MLLMKCSRFFGDHSLWIFFGQDGEIWAKIIRTPKNLSAPTPMPLGKPLHHRDKCVPGSVKKQNPIAKVC